jgi:hypothetical protein
MQLVPFVLVLVARGVPAGARTPQTVERWGVFDEGSRVWIDGQRLLDNDGEHAPVPKTGQMGLAKGLHEIRVEVSERAGGPGPRGGVDQPHHRPPADPGGTAAASCGVDAP